MCDPTPKIEDFEEKLDKNQVFEENAASLGETWKDTPISSGDEDETEENPQLPIKTLDSGVQVDKPTQEVISKPQPILKSFNTPLKTLIKMYIFILRSNGVSYGKINLATGIAKAQIFRMEKEDYLPKTPSKQQDIYDRLAKLVKIEVLI